MQTTVALSLHAILAEEQFSFDELVLALNKLLHEQGLPGLLRLLLEWADEHWAIRACREAQLPGPACCAQPKWEIKDRVQRRLRTSVGVVQFRWRRLVCRHCGRHLVPLRRRLRLARWQSKTGELERVVLETVAEQSYRRSTNHLDTIGVIPVPKSTAHRWVAQSDCDQFDWPQEQLTTLMADGTGFKRRPTEENEGSNRGELCVVLGFDARGRTVPLGTWTDKNWPEIAAELEAKAAGRKLAEQLSCDGELGVAERLAGLVNSVQRCHWHLVHDLDVYLWQKKAPKAERRQAQGRLAGLLAIQLPKTDFDAVRPQDKAALQARVLRANQELDKMVAMLRDGGYGTAANYIAYAQKRLFNYVQFWLDTGLAAPRTTSFLERLMREIGRRLKKIAFGWSESGAAKMARILIRRLCTPEQWTDYWKKKLGLTGSVLVLLRSVKTVTP